MDYTPIGHYGSAAAGGAQPQIPTPGPPPETGPNPSGKYVAYDTNVWEALALPGRHPGDESADDPLGTGDPRPGFCPPNDPLFLPWGKCANHQLEYLDYYEDTMKEMLGFDARATPAW